MKKLQFSSTTRLTTVAAFTLLLSACGSSTPDFGPIRDGLRGLGFCLVACSALKALASLIRREKRQDKNNRKEGDDDA